MKRIFAERVVIDHGNHSLEVDGIRIPWWLTDEPTISKPDPEMPVLVLSLDIYVDGTAIIKTNEGERFIDPVFGDVAEYTRRKVRDEFRAAYPDLDI